MGINLRFAVQTSKGSFHILPLKMSDNQRKVLGRNDIDLHGDGIDKIQEATNNSFLKLLGMCHFDTKKMCSVLFLHCHQNYFDLFKVLIPGVKDNYFKTKLQVFLDNVEEAIRLHGEKAVLLVS